MDSVLEQDYPNLELLVVDDGSADDTPAVLRDYARRYPEERFRFVRQLNGGQARALNWGYGLTRGDIIGYLCDDDLLAPGAVSLQAQELINDPAAAIAYSGYRVINEEGVVEDTVRPIQYSPVEALRLHDTVIGPGGLVRRWALEASDGWVESMQWMSDLVLWMDIGLGGRAVRVSEPLVSWRRHPGSVTVNLSAEHAREHLTAYDRGLALERLPALPEGVRAEGLRNACVFAAVFGGEKESWPRDRFLVLDLHRKLISSTAAGYEPGTDPDWSVVEEAAALFRELVAVVAEIAQIGAPPAPAAGGIESAVQRLRAVGALPAEDGTYTAGVDEHELRLGLLEAAVACGQETGQSTSRFAIIDLQQTPLPQADLDRLETLGFVSSAEELGAELLLRRQELERLRAGDRVESRG